MKDKRVVVVGGHEQACLVTDYLIECGCSVVLCIARSDDAGQDALFPSLVACARRHDIPVLQPGKLNSERVLSVVRDMGADIVLSLQNNMLFKKDWIDLFEDRLGIVNVHYAPLPRYGGYWPELWAIWNGESEFAVTIHYVAEGVDAGNIIAQRYFPIDPLESRKSLYEKSTRHCFDLLKEQLPAILGSKLPGRAQDLSQRTYYARGLPNDGILDLSWDQEKQSRFIRAISFPGFVGPKIKIGDRVVSVLAEDFPFYKPISVRV